MSKRVWVGLGVAVLLGALVELSLRWTGPEPRSASDVWSQSGRLVADLDATVAGARLRTGSEGCRRFEQIESAASDVVRSSSTRLLIAGGAFAAGLGISDGGHYAPQLVELVEEHLGRTLELRVLVQRGLLDARLPTIERSADAHRAELVILEISPEDLGVDAACFVAGESDHAPRYPSSALASLEALRAGQRRRWLAEFERRAARLREVDGMVSRAVENGRQFFLRFQEGFRQVPRSAGAEHLARLSLAQDHAPTAVAERVRFRTALRDCLERWEKADRRFLLLITGPPFFLAAIESLRDELHLPMVIVPPWWWDGRQRVFVDGLERPSEAVHVECAELLTVAVADLWHVSPADEREFRPLRDRARGLYEHQRRSRGHDVEIRRMVRDQAPPWIAPSDPREQTWILGGLETDGTWTGSIIEAVFSHSPGSPDSLFVEFAALPGDDEPQVQVRWVRGDPGILRAGTASEGSAWRGHVELPDFVSAGSRVGVALELPSDWDPAAVRIARFGIE